MSPSSLMAKLWALARDGRDVGRFVQRIEAGPGKAGAHSPLLHLWLMARHYREFRRMLDHLRNPARPELIAIGQANPVIPFKILRLYLHHGLSVSQRVDAVIAHYDLAAPLMGPALFHAAFATAEGAHWFDVALPNGHGLLPVRMNRFPRFCHEGEMTLSLYDPFGTLLYALTLSLVPLPGVRVGMLIGSLVGAAPKDAIKHLTKLMLGLRPHNLLVLIAQTLARQWGISQLQAVGRASLVVPPARAGQVNFDYDSFWTELGGQRWEDAPCEQTLYLLPLSAARRSEDEVPPQKRAQYRRRYAFQDDVEARLVAGLARWKQMPATAVTAAWAATPAPALNR